MSERHSAVPAGGTGPEPSDPSTEPVRYSVPQAARALGISERAVRKRIERGSLPAHREGRSWVVELTRGMGAAPDTESAVPADTNAVPAAVPGAGVDLRPLVDHIARLEGQVQQLTEAAVVWQTRAMHAEERLLALEASEERQDVPGEPSAPQHAPEPPADGDEPWVRRWWRGLAERLYTR